jgi:hypothetical protein
MWTTIVGMAALAAICWRLVYVFKRSRVRRKAATDALFADALRIIERPVFEESGAFGLPRLSGQYQGFPVQVHPIVDTLATRRLPALWLLVTLQDTLPVAGRFDMMMRPAGPTTFSNFDHLPHTLQHPDGFPEHAVVRTDDPDETLPASVIQPHLGPFFGAKAKELLITENGLRIVWLLAEAERARYGIFRQAEFGNPEIEGALLQELLDRLIAIRKDVLAWKKTA